MKLTTKHVIIAAVAMGMLVSVAPLWAQPATTGAPASTAAPAKTHKHGKRWAKNHPGRAALNSKLKTDRQDVRADEANGTLTKAQGQADMHSINNLQGQEKSDLKADNDQGNHLENGQGKNLNAEANGLGGNIPPPAPPTAAPAAAQ